MALNTTSTFLQLPAELRNKIYALALGDCKLDIDHRHHHGGTPAPGIVFACKQTYCETTHMYYTNLTVVSSDKWVLWKWLHRVVVEPPNHHLKLVNRFRVDFRNRSEQQLPLRLEQQWTLAHHSELGLEYVAPVHKAVDVSRRAKIDLKACIVSPNQEIIWTSTPLAVHEMLQRKCRDMAPEQRATQAMEQWAPLDLSEGAEWSRD